MTQALSPQFLATEKLLSRYEDEPEHARQVSMLAGMLFDALEREGGHAYGPKEREWLVIGALLHDIGWSQTPSGAGHHKWSAKLILKHGIDGYKDREVRLVALIARYHRKALPNPEKPAHRMFFRLDQEDQDRIRMLGGIIRVADALDRTHRQIVSRADVRLEEGGCAVLVTSNQRFEPERATVRKKGDLLGQALGRSVWAEAAGD